ncbi:MAG TPA: TRAP transporter substrate-binding protein [Novosphingobium sp.]|nr:TRAP transporter substrate-binding protein [Novosphingobium sp.]
MMKRRAILLALAALAVRQPASAETPGPASGVTTLRLHQMLPADAAFTRLGLQAWARAVEQDAGGRLRIEIHSGMELGGKPADLYDQARDGTVDLSWVVLGYTPGRFPATTTFELPFMVRSARATSQAFQSFCTLYCASAFGDVHVIAWHTHGPALIHASRPIASLDDLRGLRLRPGSAAIGQFLAAAGATTLAMPATQVYEALRSGQIDATTIPWSSEVNTSKPASDILHFHTAAGGPRGLYTQTFALVMNQAAYRRLPAPLRAVIDRHSGLAAARLFGQAMDESDRLGRTAALAHGDRLITLGPAETARWRQAAQPVIAAWRTAMQARGLEAGRLLARANALLDRAGRNEARHNEAQHNESGR